jgi:hypothetical protein
MTEIEMPKRMNMEALITFAEQVEELSSQVGKMSARGWCYALEGMNLITKGQFDRVETLINECRTKGYLPIDFTAEEEGRQFSGVEEPDDQTPEEQLKGVLNYALSCENQYTPDWWDGEKYYIQMIVEKIDLKTLFEPVCEDYKIPIATAKGWSSLLMRATYARRFKDAEEELGYCPRCATNNRHKNKYCDYCEGYITDKGSKRGEDE